jgi:hypothetical protein
MNMSAQARSELPNEKARNSPSEFLAFPQNFGTSPVGYEISLRMISAPALSALSFPLATRRDKGAMPQLVLG